MAAIRQHPVALPSPAMVWKSLRRDWLIELEQSPEAIRETSESDRWFSLVTSRRTQIEQYLEKSPSTDRPMVLLAEANSVRFLAGFWAALLSGCDIALANPRWGTQEWTSLCQLIAPSIIWSESSIWPVPSASAKNTSTASHPTQTQQNGSPKILIPTGGSSGNVKLTRHTWATLLSAVTGFQQHFTPANSVIHSYCVLPVYHVSGLMQALRTWIGGGQLVVADFKAFLSCPLSHVETALLPELRLSFISLVPTQLARLMQAGFAPWLSQFRGVLLGGAPPWPSLLTSARSHGIPLCLSYGMTETAAMVTAQQPQDFLAGDFSSGRTLPHAGVTIGQDGQIVVDSSAIAYNYHSAPSSQFQIAPDINTFYTDDLGYLDAAGRLHITGRASRKIISGGENIFPDEIEAQLRDTGQIIDVHVLGLPHPDWGEIVTAVYVPKNKAVTATQLQNQLQAAAQLSHYKVPRQWIALPELPRNAQGKLNEKALRSQLSARGYVPKHPI